jgi:uncharacterized protein (TIGR00255 family)
MTSMTGFGHGEHRDAHLRMTLEIRSYNNRYLDLFVNLPFNLKQLEPLVREYLSARIQRGKVEVYLGLSEAGEELDVKVDPARVTAYVKALTELKRIAGIHEKVRLSHLTGLDGILRAESRRDPEALWSSMLPLFDRVLEEFQGSRVVEGAKTEADISRLALEIKDRVNAIERLVPAIEEKLIQGLRERFHQLLGEAVDESRIMAETAVLLVKADIHEEVQRMKAHLGSLFDSLGKDGTHGKRLDFVCQELGREINTIGSKSTFLEVDQGVIAVKDALEKIREQLRNVE